MADAQAQLDSSHLFVWAPPAMRASLRSAIEMWNVALGRDYLALTPDAKQAQVHVGDTKPPPGGEAKGAAGLSQMGGDTPHSEPLQVWVSPKAMDGTDYPAWVMTHELGHALGLDDAYGPGKSNKGIMAKSVAPTSAREGLPAEAQQGLDPFAPVLAAYQANWLDHVAPAKRMPMMTAARLVVAGLRSRGVDPASYGQGGYEPADHLAQDAQVMFRAMHPTKPKAQQPVGGGQQNERKM